MSFLSVAAVGVVYPGAGSGIPLVVPACGYVYIGNLCFPYSLSESVHQGSSRSGLWWNWAQFLSNFQLGW